MKKSILPALLFIMLTTVLLPQSGVQEDTFQKATAYFFQKKFEMAELLLQEVIKKEPENAEAYSYLADIYLVKNQIDGALNLYNRSLELKPDSSENYFRIGQIYYRKKVGNVSLENFDRALQINPGLHIVYYHKGLTALMLLRDKDSTIQYWERYISLVPEDPQYENIKRVIALLKDPNFKLPPEGSDVSIQEVLLLGGATLDTRDRETENKKAGHEKKKSTDKIEEIYLDDDL